MEWSVSVTRKELQWLLEFGNFYLWFIRDNSKIASPLTTLTSVSLGFRWSPEANNALQRLKDLFSATPVVVQVELEASDVGGWCSVVTKQHPGLIS